MGERTGAASTVSPGPTAGTDASRTTADAAVNTTRTLRRRPFSTRSAPCLGPNEPCPPCLAIAGRGALHVLKKPIRDVHSGQRAVL